MKEDRDYVRKRRVPRRAFHRKVGVLGRGEYFVTFALEIGEGGMLFSSEKDFFEGQQVVVSFSIPGFVHVVCRSTIRYTKSIAGKKCYGVQFETLDFDAKRKIRSYVAQKSAEELSAAA